MKLNRSELAPAAYLFTLACRASRNHSALAARSLTLYGDHGATIAGCVRDHFPDCRKDTLRGLARDVTRYSDEAWQARPRGVHRATMLKLSRAIAARDGSGFYGPQP